MQELEYLRNELNQRITSSNDNHNKHIGNILVLWGGVLLLFTAIQQNVVGGLVSCSTIQKSTAGGNEPWAVFGYFVMITIFFISVVMMYCFSRRNYDSNNQVFRLAAYNTIFHEKRPGSGDKEGEIRAWELVTFEMTKKEMNDPNEKRNYKINNVYPLLTIFAISMKIFLLVVLFLKTPNIKDCMEDGLDIFMVVMCVIFIIFSFILLIGIYNNSVLSPQKWLERKKYHLRFFIDYAVESGYYRKDELVGRFGKKFLDDIGYSSTTADTVES